MVVPMTASLHSRQADPTVLAVLLSGMTSFGATGTL
jgi:hypothetical protein